MIFIVEFHEEETKRFRAVEVECDNKEYAHVEAMRKGAKILKLGNVYPKTAKKNKSAEREDSEGEAMIQDTLDNY